MPISSMRLMGREPLRAGVQYGVQLTVLMKALYQSADERRMVLVDPAPADL